MTPSTGSTSDEKAVMANDHAGKDLLYGSLVQALPAHMAVIDRDGRIVLVNYAWLEFAAANGGPDDTRIAVGANYLAVCRADAELNIHAARALDGIEAVLAHR